ncbi:MULTISPECIES: hypothetical protein [Mangrovibacter]|uniref:DUF1883 domain-containing protein n=1 Tax=Mangrovibacter plantisponsor TaxID=451513 RepID=A0A317Q541_9ENTR|nr:MULTISPECIES: hypothetical protein [Mangrovibacter]KEA53578.1 hypothetical protein DT73_05945 [Mangrovibacter sp. MFB070]PWW10680.1 hypothetical protein DES37_10350 [Mangrovibacter plantisponsor]
MAVVKTTLKLFGGDTVVVRCSDNCHIHLSANDCEQTGIDAEIMSVQNRNTAYLAVPFSGIWNVLIDSHSQSLEHAISYVPA